MKMKKLTEKYKNYLPAIWVASRLVLGITLIISGAHMYGNSKPEFQLVLSSLQVPGFFMHIIWIAIPWIKLYLGGFILLGIFTRTSVLLAAGFQALSIAALLYVKFSQLKVYSFPCSAFSYYSCTSAVTFNFFLILLSLGIYFFASSKFTFDSWVKEKGN